MGRYFVLTAFLFLFFNTYSQVPDAATWRYIDSSIDRKSNLSDINDLLYQLRQKAFSEKRYFDVARCYYYQLLVADQRTDDSLYFRNSAVIDSLLSSGPGNAGLQLAMHMLLAKRLASFTIKPLRFNRQRYERKDIPLNYAAYTNRQLDSMAMVHFEEAKKLTDQVSVKDIDDVLWLSSDPLTFLFKPDLFDVVIAEQINALNGGGYYGVPISGIQVRMLSLSQDKFIAQLDSVYQTPGSWPQLRYYKQWLNEKQSNPEAYYFIETLARKFVYTMISARMSDAAKVKTNYENYLSQISQSPYTPVRAHGVYQLCLLWNQDAKKYFPSGTFDYDYDRNEYRSNKDFDTTYRYHALKALRLFEQNKAMLDSFTYLKDILTKMKEMIQQVELNVAMEQYNLPGEAILAELTFKNADKLFYRTVRLKNDFMFSHKPGMERVNVPKGFPEVARGEIDLPSLNDFNKHATYLKLDSLPPGNYALLFSGLPLNDSNAITEVVLFRVSAIAVVQQNERVFVLDRKTGFPLAGANVKGSYLKKPKDTLGRTERVVKNYQVNEKGFVDIRNENIREIEVYFKKDSTYASLSPVDEDEDEPEDVYDKEEYDGLAEYYGENASAHVFTDRSIYRPGQTVHFKVVFMTRNPKTGKPMIMSKQSMKGSLFGSVYKKWIKEDEPELYLVDPFNRNVDTLKIRLNEFGSVSGSFKIPKTAATGEWSIEPDYIDVGEKNEGSFSVEEYKRPSYEVSIEKPKKELLPGDTFSVKARVRSFAGAALDGVRINYTISRNGSTPYYDSLLGKTTERYDRSVIADTAGYTNGNGELEITTNDFLLKEYALNNDKRRNFSYEIEVEAIDLTGEAYKAETEVKVSSRPVTIGIPVDATNSRDKLKSIRVTASDENAGKVSKDITIKVYRIIKEEKLYSGRELGSVDQWLFPKEQWEQWLPLVDFGNSRDTGTKKLLFERTVNTGKNEKLDFDPAVLVAGNYFIEARCVENGILKGKLERSFSVFDEKENKLAERSWLFHHMPINSLSPGDTINYVNGNSAQAVYSVYYVKYYSGEKKTSIIADYDFVKQEKGISHWKWKIPSNAIDQVLLTQFYIINNELFSREERIYINGGKVAEPEIIVEQYRQKLSPGSKETFAVSIKTNNDNLAAELMTTLYDASLDKLEKHKWEKPEELEENRRRLRNYRDNDINSATNSSYYYYQDYYKGVGSNRRHRNEPLWWVNPQSSSFAGSVYGFWNLDDEPASMRGSYVRKLTPAMGATNASLGFSMSPSRALEGRAAGVSLASTTGLNEVVMVGYGTSELASRMNVTGSVIRIRGAASLSSYQQPLIILDGVPFEGDLGTLDPNTITQGLVLKGADAAALYGSRASNGVLVLSTKGDIVFPVPPPEPPPPARKNFNETAFFFPAIYAGKDGYYKFTFTMPESVTEWNWKMLAHTKKAQFVYAERKLTTQLPLMVQPNMPRLLYQGDRIVLQSRISNLDSSDISGKAICKIEDMVTGEDLTSLFMTKKQNDFLVAKKTNVSSAFEIKVPAAQLNPVKITVSVQSQNFTDGEEHIIPVLSPNILVKENIAFRFVQNTDTIIPAPVLPGDAAIYGMGLSILTRPQSTLINALPYLANYSFDCAEQVFNKMMAHLTALKLMRKDKEAQQSFEKAKQVMEHSPGEIEPLPGETDEQATPWLNLGHEQAKQQKQLFELLDTNRTKEQVGKYLDKLTKLQDEDGGMTWFSGGKSNAYISNYVLAGLGKLQTDSFNQPELFRTKQKEIGERLLLYCQEKFDELKGKSSYDPLFYVYARSFWNRLDPLSDSSKAKIRRFLTEEWKKAPGHLYNQAMLIIVTLKYFDRGSDEYKKATGQLRSIKQLAIRDDVNGTRWKELADSDDMTYSSEETLALLAEAFTEGGMSQDLFPGIIQWLLTAKNEDHWSSTKATAAVIEMLAKENNTATGVTQTISTVINNKQLSVTDDLLSGSNLSFAKENTSMPVTLRKEKNIPATGTVIWYYFSPGDNVNRANKEVNLEKELFRYNETMAKWEPVDGRSLLKIADKIKVVLTIETPKALQYVYIDDKRAAGFEPEENHSGYEYAEGVSYYRSVRDAGMQFFTEFIPAGRTVLSYEMIVAHEGDFINGPASLQCMYKPAISAYSNGIRIKTSR